MAFNQRSGAQATPREGNWEINRLISVIFLHPVFCPELPIDWIQLEAKVQGTHWWNSCRLASQGASQVALVVKNLPANAGFIPWAGKIPWRRAWQSTPVFLTGESHGQKNLVGYSPCGRKESNTTETASHTQPPRIQSKIQEEGEWSERNIKISSIPRYEDPSISHKKGYL